MKILAAMLSEGSDQFLKDATHQKMTALASFRLMSMEALVASFSDESEG